MRTKLVEYVLHHFLKRLLIVAAIVSVAASLVVQRMTTLGTSVSWVLLAVGIGSAFLLLGIDLSEVLSIRLRPGQSKQLAMGTVAASSGPQFTLFQMMLAIAIVSVMCWFAAMLVPLWSATFHDPTDAEMARRFRRDAARWTRLASENPTLAKEYSKLAKTSIRSAVRSEQRAKRSPP